MHSLRLFCEVAKHRSFSQAAVGHGITQSAASQRIGQLEKKLGVKLIDRSVRPLTLTPAGTEYLNGCQDLLERYDSLELRVARFKPQNQASVRVDAIYSAGIDLLNQIQESFETLHPGIKVTLSYKHPEEVYEAVRAQRCDLGILSYPRRWQQVQAIALRDEPMAVVCSPQHPLAGYMQIHASQLQEWSLVTFEQSLPVGRRIRQYLRDNGVNPHVANVFDNIDTLKSVVAVTQHVAILPHRTVRHEQRSGTLSVIGLEPKLVRPMGIIYHRHQGKPFAPAVQDFMDYLQQHAGPNGEADQVAQPSDPATNHPIDQPLTLHKA